MKQQENSCINTEMPGEIITCSMAALVVVK
jgi:hypothetical protein